MEKIAESKELQDPFYSNAAKECIDSGGCYIRCIGCGLYKPPISFVEMIDFYMPRWCNDVCIHACLYPVE